jgi:predicted membrane GTPase involved in stress response
MLDYDSYVGRIANGRIYSGSIKTGEAITLIKRDGKTIRSKVTRILKYLGMHRVEVKEALAGDIVSIAGIEDVHVGETLASPLRPEALPLIKIDEPTISMFFSHNTSPLSGKDGGRFLTSRHIRERLAHEAMINVGIRVEDADGGERFKVSGRGELHLAILIETMRREGYEMEVSRPRVILKEADNACTGRSPVLATSSVTLSSPALRVISPAAGMTSPGITDPTATSGRRRSPQPPRAGRRPAIRRHGDADVHHHGRAPRRAAAGK